MKLIVGLGNPGVKYEKTRHNLGFRIIDQVGQEMKIGNWKIDLQFNALIVQGHFNNQKIILAKPQTFMNNSGQAVKVLANYYKIPTEEILVIHDDIDLPLEEIRIQKSRGAAGHKGVQSIIDNLRTKNFIRMRIGIKPTDNEQPTVNVEKFVLEKITAQEEKAIRQIIKKAADLIIAAL
jgi:PTH1 family peptidyl-tRNA hydrolase